MTKVLMITDMHWGIRDGDVNYLNNMNLFLDNVLFPYIDTYKITKMLNLGDLVHNRKKIGFTVLNHLRNEFLQPLQDRSIEVKFIVGNHDMPFKEVYESNAARQILSQYDNFTIVDDIMEFPEWDMIMVPWITKNNRDQFLQKLASTKMRRVAGHLELNGFNFSKMQVAVHGDDPKGFEKFEAVFSGHYHYRHSKGNIHYLGSPTEQTWIDVDTVRGFHVLDTETGEVEFITNPYNYFEYVQMGSDSYKEMDHPRHYRLRTNSDHKQSEIDGFVKLLNQHGAIKVDVIADKIAKTTKEVSESEQLSLDEIEDTPTFISGFVDDEQVANILIDLYNRAVNEMDV